MLMANYTAELLNLEAVIITNVENVSDQLHIHIELPRIGISVLPVELLMTGSATIAYRPSRMSPLARDTFLHLRKRRYRCDCGKRFFESNPFLPRYYRVTG